MSKLEKALRHASEQHAGARRSLLREPAIPGPHSEDDEDTIDKFLPVRYHVKPEWHHELDPKLLEKGRIIREGFPAEALTQYKMLRTRIVQEYSAHSWKTLGVTSPVNGAGKTVTAINLAITLASQGHLNVFLVDLDLRNPSVAECLGLPMKLDGVPEYLDKNVDLAGMLWDVGVENLIILPNRSKVHNSSECLTSKRMQELLTILKSGAPNPVVIFDLPPVLVADDVNAFSPFIDGLLVVASERETNRDDLSHTMDVLRTAGANVLGVVLNKTGS